MTAATFTRADIDALAKFDTATICNALEVLLPEYRSNGFTKSPLIAARPALKPVVGIARVGRIRAAEPPRGPTPDRVSWYEYVARADHPSIVVIQDVDDPPGIGCFWGEVHSAVHKALGAAGCVTNGSYRDTLLLAEGFQILGGHVGPSHAHVHLVEYGEPVEVCGMQVAHGDIVHADYQGAVVIPADCVSGISAAVDLVGRREKAILDVCRDSKFTVAKLKQALASAKEIH
jgi:regulator of RNase E activity RraA